MGGIDSFRSFSFIIFLQSYNFFFFNSKIIFTKIVDISGYALKVSLRLFLQRVTVIQQAVLGVHATHMVVNVYVKLGSEVNAVIAVYLGSSASQKTAAQVRRVITNILKTISF